MRFGTGSGFYADYTAYGEAASPFSNESMSSPFYDTSPSNDVEASYFGFNPTSPRNAAALVDLENFSFKRLRSLDSGLLESTDSSPVSRSSKVSKTSPTHITISRRPMPQPTSHEMGSPGERYHPELDHVPILKLGDEGRSKLKSALSEKSKIDADIKAQIDAIGKIRLASVQQLMQMAQVSGLWDYAQSLAKDHEVAKVHKRWSS